MDGIDLIRAVVAVAGDSGGRILGIGHNPDMTTDQKQRAIYDIDKSVLGWTSKRWSDLCDVSEQQARDTDWWKVDRKQLIQDSRG